MEQANECYWSARNLLKVESEPKSILFLTIRLNQLLFKYDFCNKKEQSYRKLRDLFESHLGYLVSMNEDQAKDYTQVLNAIENNLELWRQELDSQKK